MKKLIKSIFFFTFLFQAGVGNSQTGFEKKILQLKSYGDERMNIRIATNYKSISAGINFKIAFFIQTGLGWYTYSDKVSGENMPTQIDLILPEGFEIIKSIWPHPKDSSGEYSGNFMVVYEVKSSENISKEINIPGSVSWQVCDGNICTMNDVSFNLMLEGGKIKKSEFFNLINI